MSNVVQLNRFRGRFGLTKLGGGVDKADSIRVWAAKREQTGCRSVDSSWCAGGRARWRQTVALEFRQGLFSGAWRGFVQRHFGDASHLRVGVVNRASFFVFFAFTFVVDPTSGCQTKSTKRILTYVNHASNADFSWSFPYLLSPFSNTSKGIALHKYNKMRPRSLFWSTLSKPWLRLVNLNISRAFVKGLMLARWRISARR